MRASVAVASSVVNERQFSAFARPVVHYHCVFGTGGALDLPMTHLLNAAAVERRRGSTLKALSRGSHRGGDLRSALLVKWEIVGRFGQSSRVVEVGGAIFY